MSDLHPLDTVGLADAIRRNDCSPREAVEGAIDRIQALDGDLNAVVTERFDAALAEAEGDLADGPFRGVPMLLKDLWPAMDGEPLHLGVKALKEADYRADVDSAITERYRAAGFVIIGRTNTPELGLVATTEPESYGPSRNPWNTEHGTGGSSGGAAAAVASGMIPAANASDGGGSIRIPAAMCGLVGLKPSRGRVPMGPLQDEWGLSVQHVVCHTVRDAAAILDVSAIPTLGDGVIAPDFGRPYAGAAGADPGALRVGFWADAPQAALELHPACRAAVQATAKELSALGHEVTEGHPATLDDEAMAGEFTAMWMAGAQLSLDRIGGMLGRPVTADDVEPATWVMAEMAASVSGFDLMKAQAAMHTYRRGIADWWESGFDLLVTPTTCQPAPRLGELTPSADDPIRGLTASIPYAAYTSPFNVSGQPAISLPLAQTDDGLPVGVQIVAAYGREDVLLSIAAQLEAAGAFVTGTPAVHADHLGG